MQEKTLLKLSVLATVLGLALLWFFAQDLNLKVVEDIQTAPSSQQVKVRGILGKVTQHDRVVFLTLQGEKVETMDVILFPKDNLFLREGDYVEIEGQVEDYQGTKEIVGSKVTIK